MSLELRIDGVLLTNRVRMTGGSRGGIAGLPSAAWYGQTMTAGLEIDDPAGDFEIIGWQTFTADETSCSKPRIFSGWIAARRITRGPYRQGDGRVIDCDIVDSNALFGFEPFRASSAKRPEETDIARVAYARASAPMSHTPAADNGRFNVTDNPVNFGPADYVTQYPGELFNSVAGISGKNFYTYWDDDEEEISIFYDLIGANPLSSLAISNVESDADSTTFFPTKDGELTTDPAYFVNAILFGYLGGNYVYAENSSLIDDMSPTEFSPSQFIRTEVYRTDRVGKVATANNLAQSMLQDRASEKQTITCRIRLPAAQVNLVQAGDRISARFTHLDLDTPEELPVIRRNVIPAPGRRDMYDVDLELSTAISYVGPGGGDPGEGPFDPVACDIANVTLIQDAYADSVESPPDTYTATWDTTPTAGNMLVCSWLSNTNALLTGSMPAGWEHQISAHVVALGGQAKLVSIWTKVAEASEPTAVTVSFGLSGQAFQYQLQEWAGVDTVDVAAAQEDEIDRSVSEVVITPTTGGLGVIVTSHAYDGALSATTGGGLVIDSNRGANPPAWAMGHLLVASATGTYTLQIVNTGGFHKGCAVAVMLTCSGSTGAPGALMHVKNEFVADGDGTTTDFATRFPYVAGSLEVFVDGVPIINGITEVDPDAGTFSLDFAPQAAVGDTRAERVTVNYQASPGT